MALPRTYLSVAPAGMEDMFGREILSANIIAGLQRINPQIRVPMPEHYATWYPLQKMGVTCLWLGEPGKGRKICAFRLGAVPEFTQLGSGGKWMVRGWRSIFAKVIAAHAATVRQIERQFGVVLETDGLDGSCVACRKEGRLKAAEANGKRLCGAHQEARDVASSGTTRRRFVVDRMKRLTDHRYAKRAKKEITECLST